VNTAPSTSAELPVYLHEVGEEFVETYKCWLRGDFIVHPYLPSDTAGIVCLVTTGPWRYVLAVGHWVGGALRPVVVVKNPTPLFILEGFSVAINGPLGEADWANVVRLISSGTPDSPAPWNRAGTVTIGSFAPAA